MESLPKGPGMAAGFLSFAWDLATMRDLNESALESQRRYGDPMTLSLPGRQIVITGDPAAVKTIFTADPDLFLPGFPKEAEVFLGKGSVFLMSGAAHKRARKLLMPPFHGERMRAYGALMRDVTIRHTSRWEKGKPFSIIDTTQAITLDVIIEAVFGVQGEDRVQKFHEAIVGAIAALVPSIATFTALRRDFFGVGPWARFQRKYRALRDMTFALMAAHRASLEGREDILSMLMLARDEEGGALSEQEILDQLLTIVVAGHETTAVSLAWAFYRLLQDEGALAKVLAEIDALGESPAPDALAKLPYLEAIIQETLRLYPVLSIVTRKLARPFELKGYRIPAGVVVGAAIPLVHYREDLYPDPRRFRPERFLERSYTAFEHIPFGGGARRCLGAAFAMYEMKIVLATILSRYRLALREKAPVPAILRGPTVGPRGGVRVELIGAAESLSR